MIGDISRSGAKILSPADLGGGEEIEIEIEMIGKPLLLLGRVISCEEEPRAKIRFERTFALHVQFHEELGADMWKSILAMK